LALAPPERSRRVTAGGAKIASMLIEPCPAARAPDASRFLRALLYEEFNFTPDPVLDRDFENLCAHYRSGRGEIWIATESPEATIRATAALLDRGEDAELKRMFVEKSARGHGLGRRLLEVALAHARAAGFSRVVLDSTRDMTAALSLYRAAGFREIPDYNGNRRADVFMALPL
jgi:GNAT superfamily N-acetyltransferase